MVGGSEPCPKNSSLIHRRDIVIKNLDQMRSVWYQISSVGYLIGQVRRLGGCDTGSLVAAGNRRSICAHRHARKPLIVQANHPQGQFAVSRICVIDAERQHSVARCDGNGERPKRSLQRFVARRAIFDESVMGSLTELADRLAGNQKQ